MSQRESWLLPGARTPAEVERDYANSVGERLRQLAERRALAVPDRSNPPRGTDAVWADAVAAWVREHGGVELTEWQRESLRWWVDRHPNLTGQPAPSRPGFSVPGCYDWEHQRRTR